MVDSALFIGTAIIAVTQFIKYLAPQYVNGATTIGVAVVLGVLSALLDTSIGLTNISVAMGIIIALSAVGVHSTVRQIG